MANKEDHQLQWFVEVVRRWWILLAGCLLVPALATFIIFTIMPPVYEATVVMMIEPAEDKINSQYSALIAGEQLAITYSQMITTQTVLQNVIDQLGLDIQPDKLAKKIDVIPINNTQLIQVTVRDSSARQSALLANTIAEVLIAQIQSLQERKYSGSLDSLQAKIDELNAEIDAGEERRTSLNAQIITQNSEIGRLNTLLDQDKSNLNNLQQNYHTLQINVTQLTDKIHVVGPATTKKVYIQSGYQATTTLLFDQEMIAGSSGYVTGTSNAQLAVIYGPMLSSQPVIEETAAALGLHDDFETLADSVSYQAVPATQLVHIYVINSDEETARLFADTLATVFVKQIQAQLAEPYSGQLAEIQAQIDSLEQQVQVDQANLQEPALNKVNAETELTNLEAALTDDRSDLRAYEQQYDDMRATTISASDDAVISAPAALPQEPVSNRSLFTAIAAVVGALAGIGLAFVLETFNDRIHSPRDVHEIAGLLTIATIGKLEKNTSDLIMGQADEAFVQEDFHMLGTRVRTLIKGQSLRTILITSPASSTGKSFITANLAAEMARAGLKVIAVDADLRFPRLHKLFGLKQVNGLSAALNGRKEIVPRLQNTSVPGLKVLTSQTCKTNPADVFSSPHLSEMIEGLKNQADLVLVDSPPVLSVPDTVILSSLVDGVLLVLRADQTPTNAFKNSISSLSQNSTHLIGVVLNDLQVHRDGYYRYVKPAPSRLWPADIWKQMVSAIKKRE